MGLAHLGSLATHDVWFFQLQSRDFCRAPPKRLVDRKSRLNDIHQGSPIKNHTHCTWWFTMLFMSTSKACLFLLRASLLASKPSLVVPPAKGGDQNGWVVPFKFAQKDPITSPLLWVLSDWISQRLSSSNWWVWLLGVPL